jgi:hypothetical protein
MGIGLAELGFARRRKWALYGFFGNMKNHLHYILFELLLVTIPWALAIVIGFFFIKVLF